MSVIGTAGFRVQVVTQPTSDNTDPSSQMNTGPDSAIDSNSSVANSVANAAEQRVASTSVLPSSQTTNGKGSDLLTNSQAANNKTSAAQLAARTSAEQAAKAAAASRVATANAQQQTPPPPPQDGPHINADGQVTGTLLNVKA
jgi:hypothetical protein